ncbi:MAG: hypothetical protein K2X97_13665, partial [Mycobacteriaceae bacterium]|nr:hypothetical protein [Mycobacteriaceae bacterium]
MTNDQITYALDLTAKLMDLHGENAFKSRAYTNAAYKLEKLRYNFTNKTQADIEAIEGIGKGIATKLIELIATGTTKELTELCQKTPEGVIKMLGIKGLGPKKVRQLWQEL